MAAAYARAKIGFVLVVRCCFDMRTSSTSMHAVSILLLTLYVPPLAGILLWAALALLVVGTVLAVYEGLLLARSKTMLPGIGAFILLCSVFSVLHHSGQLA